LKRPRPVAETSWTPLQARFSRTEILLLLLLAGSFEILLSRALPELRRYLDLPLILVLYLSLHSTAAKGAFWGTCFGLLSDLLLGTLMGLNGLSKTLIGCLVGLLRLRAAAEGVLGRMLLLGAAASLDTILIVAILDLLGQPLSNSLLLFIAGRSCVTSLVGVFVFHGYDRIKFPPKDFSRKSMVEGDPF
jgi:rod shape-determining protein MreD